MSWPDSSIHKAVLLWIIFCSLNTVVIFLRLVGRLVDMSFRVKESGNNQRQFYSGVRAEAATSPCTLGLKRGVNVSCLFCFFPASSPWCGRRMWFMVGDLCILSSVPQCFRCVAFAWLYLGRSLCSTEKLVLASLCKSVPSSVRLFVRELCQM